VTTELLLQEGSDYFQRSLRRVERADAGGKDVRHPLPDVRRRVDPLATGSFDVAARIVQEDLARSDVELDWWQTREAAIERRGDADAVDPGDTHGDRGGPSVLSLLSAPRAYETGSQIRSH
jgi:hypothetical protein